MLKTWLAQTWFFSKRNTGRSYFCWMRNWHVTREIPNYSTQNIWNEEHWKVQKITLKHSQLTAIIRIRESAGRSIPRANRETICVSLRNHSRKPRKMKGLWNPVEVAWSQCYLNHNHLNKSRERLLIIATTTSLYKSYKYIYIYSLSIRA